MQDLAEALKYNNINIERPVRMVTAIDMSVAGKFRP